MRIRRAVAMEKVDRKLYNWLRSDLPVIPTRSIASMTETAALSEDLNVELTPRRMRPGIADDATELIGNTPAGALVAICRGCTRAARGQARGVQPRIFGQGPHRRGDDRGRRGAGHHRAGCDDHRRADERQYRDRAGLGGGGEGLPADSDHAGEHESGAAGAAARLRGGAYPHTGVRRDVRGGAAGGADRRRDAERLDAAAIRESRPTPRSTGARRPSRCGRTRAGRSTFSSPVSARAGRSLARGKC